MRQKRKKKYRMQGERLKNVITIDFDHSLLSQISDISETEEISVLATYLSLPASPVALLTQPRSGILAGLVKR